MSPTEPTQDPDPFHPQKAAAARAEGTGSPGQGCVCGVIPCFPALYRGDTKHSQCSRSAKPKSLQLWLPRVPPARQMLGQAANVISSLIQDGDEEGRLELSVSVINF